MAPAQKAPGAGGESQVAEVLDVLVKLGKLKAEDREKARMAYVTTGMVPEMWVVKEGLVDEGEMMKAKAKARNLPFVSLADKAIAPVAMGYIDRNLAERLEAMPFDYKPTTGELAVAMANPWDLAAIEFLEKKTGAKIKVYAAERTDVKAAIDSNYQQSLSTEVTAALKEAGGASGETAKSVGFRKGAELKEKAPVASIISTILEFAIKSRASDVHIEPLEERTRVRYRIDGILHEKLVLPKAIHDALVSRVKILSGMKIDEKRVPQDGRFNFQVDEEEVDLRVSTMPTVFGEKVVMRLLKKTGAVPSLPELGLRGRALKNFEEAILRPHGIILVTGPTGSGKTTTLYSVLSRINTTKVNVMTLEDPVEYQIGGVNQVQINPQAGLTFASGMRSFLRQDPNIIMVGEVRDVETAELAIQAALTGHLVFSTLHTNNASGALPRLLDMQAEAYLLASTITAIVGQRVTRRICTTCKTVYQPTAEVEQDIREILGKLWTKDPSAATGGVNSKLELSRGEGCEQCGNTGYRGRIGIFEVLPVTEKIGRLILERASAVEIEKAAVAEGMITMKQDGYMKAVEGITSIDEVLRVAQE